jgi:phage repressor protein C with HTH and peptisase S24 domain
MRKHATVLVEGDSMEPTYSDGDWLMARWDSYGLRTTWWQLGNRVKVDDVVVIERAEQPGIFYVKRISEINSEEYKVFVRSDNQAGTDSRTWGWLPGFYIKAKVVSRVRKSKKK